MNKKKIIIGFSLLAAFLAVMALALWALQKEPSEDLKIEQAKQEAIENAELQNTNEEGFINASVISKPEQHFQITYQEEVDRFDIIIQTGGRNAEKYLTKEETLQAREDAEEYFLEEVLKTQDRPLACETNARIMTVGYGEFFIPPSPLSFCENE